MTHPEPDQYDSIAAAYADMNETSAANALYERPAIQAAVGDVDGLAVLDAGCGAGPLAQWLLDAGARVTAFDGSPAMAALAARRLGARADVRVADLNQPLAFLASGSFDLVVASLVLHYLADWGPPLGELHRVLRPGGRLVFSTHHPTFVWRTFDRPDYFATELIEDEWMMGGCPHSVRFYQRPLTAMSHAIAAAGFLIERITEPSPGPEFAAADPDAYRRLSAKPWFVVFSLVRPP